MSYSSSTRSLLSETLSWVFFAAVCTGTVIYFDDLKRLAHTVLGTDPAMIAALEQADDAAAKAETAPTNYSGYVVELKAGPSGHFHADAEINGREIHVLVDTGATMVALSYEDAERAGIYMTDKDFTRRASTANGTSRVAPVTLDSISIGDITVRNVPGMVTEPGALDVTLLGMSFLGQLERVDMRSGTLILED
jgi:aspartyl protease family protein